MCVCVWEGDIINALGVSSALGGYHQCIWGISSVHLGDIISAFEVFHRNTYISPPPPPPMHCTHVIHDKRPIKCEATRDERYFPDHRAKLGPNRGVILRDLLSFPCPLFHKTLHLSFQWEKQEIIAAYISLG